jgi:tetratricopeptide (TPR) repeat protein
MKNRIRELNRIFLATALLPALLGGCVAPGGEDEKIPVLPGVEVESVLGLNNVGVGYLERHRYGKALEQFQQLVELAPEWAVGHVNLGIALMNLRRNDEAMVEFDRGLDLDPENANAAYCKGLIFRNQGESDLAIAMFGKGRKPISWCSIRTRSAIGPTT